MKTNTKFIIFLSLLSFMVGFFYLNPISEIVKNFIKLSEVVEEEFLPQPTKKSVEKGEKNINQENIKDSTEEIKVNYFNNNDSEMPTNLVDISNEQKTFGLTNKIQKNYHRSYTNYKGLYNPNVHVIDWQNPQLIEVNIHQDLMEDDISINGTYYKDDNISNNYNYNVTYSDNKNLYELIDEVKFNLPFYIYGDLKPNESAPAILFTPQLIGIDNWQSLLEILENGKDEMSVDYEDFENVSLAKFIRNNPEQMKLVGNRKIKKIDTNIFQVTSIAEGHFETSYELDNPQKGKLIVTMIIDMIKKSNYNVDVQKLPFVSNESYTSIMNIKHETNIDLPFEMEPDIYIDAIKSIDE